MAVWLSLLLNWAKCWYISLPSVHSLNTEQHIIFYLFKLTPFQSFYCFFFFLSLFCLLPLSVLAPASHPSHFKPCTHMRHLSFHLPSPLFLRVSQSQCLFQGCKGKQYIHKGKECDQRTGIKSFDSFHFAVLFRFLQREM